MVATTKAVVLAAGRGTRMLADSEGMSDSVTPEQLAAASKGLKAMMPMGKHRFLDHVLTELADGGITDVCLVVRPDDSLIRDWYRTQIRPARLRITFADQETPRGTADALLSAAEFAGDSVVLMLNGDNHYPAHIVRELAAAHAAALPGFDAQSLVELGGIQADRLRAYAILRVNDAGDLVDIVEKPDEATFKAAGPHALISMNIWSFPPAIFEACRAVQPSARGELELADAVRYAIRNLGVRFAVRAYTAAVLDLSNRRDIAAVTVRLRDRSVMV